MRHGYPVAILSDQGPNVDGQLVRQLCQRLGIRKLHSTPYHPQGDGEAERSIQTFKQSMRCQIEERGVCRTDWPRLLQEICFIHNSQVNSSTGVTPNEVMFGTRLRTRVDATLPTEEGTAEDAIEYHQQSLINNHLLFDRVSRSMSAARERMKRSYDHGTRVSGITPGDWVLVKDETRDSLSPIFRGPWEVLKRREANVHLKIPGVEKPRVVHLDRCNEHICISRLECNRFFNPFFCSIRKE